MKNDKNLYLGLAIFGFIGIGVLYFSQQNNSSGSQGVVKYHDVDRLRKETIVKSKMLREKVTVENYQNAPELSEKYRQVDDGQQQEGLRLEASVSAAAKDIAEGELQSLAVSSLENKINQKLLNEQQSAQMNVFQKKRFADEYKKKALAMGFQVELNDQLEIIKVQKAPEAQKPMRASPVIDVDSIEEEEESE